MIIISLKNKNCRLCGGEEETVNKISERSKVSQMEYNTRRDWRGEVSHWEYCKKLEFDYTDK